MFWINKGPWSDLDAHQAFMPGVPERKPLSANFYPEDMTKADFEKLGRCSARKGGGRSERILLRHSRNSKTGDLRAVPYSEAYQPYLKRISGLLRDAAEATATLL